MRQLRWDLHHLVGGADICVEYVAQVAAQVTQIYCWIRKCMPSRILRPKHEMRCRKAFPGCGPWAGTYRKS